MNRVVKSLSRNFSTCQISQRWHKDKVENRHWYRFGYKDKVKQTGPLPRLSEDAPKIEDQKIFEPEAQFAPCRALSGQNDYIDILGEDPEALKPKAYMAQTAVPEVKPKDWDFLWKRVDRRYKELRRTTDQELWKNYDGIRVG